MNIRAILHRLVALLTRRRLERDLDEELAFHLAMREADYRDEGASEADARVAARRRFGSVAYLKEQCRDMWTFHPFETLLQDVRYAFRTLRQAPGFTLVAVFALAVGIGGNTAIFSLLDAVRGGALPYRDADRLVADLGHRAALEGRAARRLIPRLSGLAAAVAQLRGHGRRRHAEHDARRRRRSRTDPDRVRVGAVLLAARPLAGARPRVPRRRR